MHTTLQLNNLFFIARQTAYDTAEKDNFKQLTDDQRKVLTAIFKAHPEHSNISARDITDITNTLRGIGPKRAEDCWSKFKRFILSLFRLRISTESLQDKARELPAHFTRHDNFQLETTKELEEVMDRTISKLDHALYRDWIRTQHSGPHLFLVENGYKPLLMNLDNQEALLPDELKNFLNHDKEAIRRTALFLTQGIGGSVFKKIMDEYPIICMKTDPYFNFYFENNSICIKLLVKQWEEGELTGKSILTIQTIDLINLDSTITLDCYHNF